MQPGQEGKWSGIEQRRHKRVHLGVPVECRAGEAKIAGRAENMSSSGLLIRAATAFGEDAEITVSFTLPNASSEMQCRARVAHVVPGVFMGVEFLDLSQESLALIEQYVASNPALQAKRT